MINRTQTLADMCAGRQTLFSPVVILAPKG